MRYLLIVAMLVGVGGCGKPPVSGIVIDNNNFDNMTSLTIGVSPPITIIGIDNEARKN